MSTVDAALMELRVARRRTEAEGIISLDLVAPDGVTLPPFEAGAHVDLHLPSGRVRQYSLCGDPRDGQRYRLGVLRDPASRGGSVELHECCIVGATVRVGAPRNHFPLAAQAQHSVLAGGGIGITPMIAMAHQLHARGASFELHYCVRSQATAAFIEELQAAPFAAHLHLHRDDGDAAQRFEPQTALPPAAEGTHLYVCGPTGFMDWVIGQAQQRGYAPAQIHREYFSAEVDTSGAAFEVVAPSSGVTVRVAAGQTIVEALATAGIALPVSCEEGVCGTCLVNVLEGIPDHRDVFLTDEEKAANDQMLPCCSRALSSRLVLDL